MITLRDQEHSSAIECKGPECAICRMSNLLLFHIYASWVRRGPATALGYGVVR